MAGEEIVTRNQHEFRQSYAATVHPSVRLSIGAAVTWLNGGSPTRISIGSRVSRALEQVSNSSGVLTWLLVTLPAPAIFLGTTSRSSLDDRTPDSGSILEGCYRRGNERTMKSPLTNGMSFGGKEGVARTYSTRLSVSELFVPVLSRPTGRWSRGHTSLVPFTHREKYCTDAEIRAIENG